MIARMKHFISFLIFAICACCFLTPSAPVKTASAETLNEVYAVAPTSDVWFYSEPLDNKGLFILPESYYVRILNDSDPFCQVQYLNKTGYCKRSDLLFVDFVPARPFLLYDYTLSYSMENGSSVGNGIFDSIERTVSYYGSFLYGTETYYYVCADGLYDYVPKTQEIIYEHNTDYLTPSSSDNNSDNSQPSKSGKLSGVEIAVICIVCAATVAVAFFVLRGKKPSVIHSDEQADF